MISDGMRRAVARGLRELGQDEINWPTLSKVVMGHMTSRGAVVQRLAELVEPDSGNDETVACRSDLPSDAWEWVQRHGGLEFLENNYNLIVSYALAWIVDESDAQMLAGECDRLSDELYAEEDFTTKIGERLGVDVGTKKDNMHASIMRALDALLGKEAS